MSGPSAVVYTYLGEFNNLHHRDKMVAFGASFVGIGTVVLPGKIYIHNITPVFAKRVD